MMEEMNLLAPAKALHEDPRLRIVVEKVSENLRCESFYVFGSHSRGSQNSQSDLDVLVLVKLPVLVSSIVRLRPAFASLRRYKVDLNVITLSALRPIKRSRSTPLTPLLVNWRKQAVLIYGRDLLPEPEPLMDPSSFARFVSRVARWFLGFLKVDVASARITLESGGARWLAKQANNMIENCAIKGVPERWGLFGQRMREEASRPNPDLKTISASFAGMLESIVKDVGFSALDQTLYVFTVFVTRKKLLLSTLFKKDPVQIRFVKAMMLLFKSAGAEKLDRKLVLESLRLLVDHTGGKEEEIRSENPYALWKLAQGILLEFFDTALRLPFGIVVFNRGPESPRIVFV